ncbi:MAG: hypothetical protein QXI16_02640 [Sulfolobaceae archaeon]
MIYRLKYIGKDFTPSAVGERIKDVYKLDTYKNELVKVGELDLQEQIQSFASMTNYKELIEKLHSPDDIAQYYPTRMNAIYADISEFSSHYMENRELFQTVLDVVNNIKMQNHEPVQQELVQEKEQEVNSNVQ